MKIRRIGRAGRLCPFILLPGIARRDSLRGPGGGRGKPHGLAMMGSEVRQPDSFHVERTTLGDLAVGDEVNIETDILGKYVRQVMKGRALSAQDLENAGWLESCRRGHNRVRRRPWIKGVCLSRRPSRISDGRMIVGGRRQQGERRGYRGGGVQGDHRTSIMV